MEKQIFLKKVFPTLKKVESTFQFSLPKNDEGIHHFEGVVFRGRVN